MFLLAEATTSCTETLYVTRNIHFRYGSYFGDFLITLTLFLGNIEGLVEGTSSKRGGLLDVRSRRDHAGVQAATHTLSYTSSWGVHRRGKVGARDGRQSELAWRFLR